MPTCLSPAKHYDERKRVCFFLVGDLILKRQFVLSKKEDNLAAELCDRFDGPYKIKRRLSPVVYILINKKRKYAGKEHTRHLKPYVQDARHTTEIDSVNSRYRTYPSDFRLPR